MQSERVIVLQAGRAERNYWIDIAAYRELFVILAWRDIAVRYKQTALGVAWALIRPLLTLAIFSVLFGRVAKLPSEGTAPYPMLVFAGMLPWTLFSTILSDASNSLVANSNLIGKVYFPRLIVPSATVLVALVDFAITLLMFLAMMLFYGVAPTWRILFVPFFTLLSVAAAMGPALLMTAMNVKYRDFRHVIPFMLQIGLYVSPVGFSSSVIPEGWRLVYSLNPAVAIVDGFRWCLLGNQGQLYVPGFVMGLVTILVLGVVGILYFRRTENAFADLI